MTTKSQLAKVREALERVATYCETMVGNSYLRDEAKQAITILDTIAQAGDVVEPEWFFRWAARAKGDGRYQEAVDVIFNHPANPYANENQWAKAQPATPKQPEIAERLADALDSCLKELWSDRHSNMSEERFKRELAPEHEALTAYEKQKGRG